MKKYFIKQYYFFDGMISEYTITLFRKRILFNKEICKVVKLDVLEDEIKLLVTQRSGYLDLLDDSDALLWFKLNYGG